MFGWSRKGGIQSLFVNRYANEWVGLLVLGAFILFGVAVVEAGFLRQWLTPSGTLHFILPANGVAGIGVGSDVEVMGAHAGEIRRLDLNHSGRMYAVATIEPQFEPFIRTDSVATIRRRFIVAGASYVDIDRGRSQPLDWGFAVLPVVVAPNPEDMILATIKDVHARIVPAMDNLETITEKSKLIITGLQEGKGTAGALLTRDETVKRLNQLLGTLDTAIANIKPLEKEMNRTMVEARGTLANTKAIMGDLKKSMPQVNGIISHTDAAVAQLPGLLVEAEATAASLRRLTNQLRNIWILGGPSGKRHPRRLPAADVRP